MTKYSYTLKVTQGKWKGRHEHIWGFDTRTDAERGLGNALEFHGLHKDTSAEFTATVQPMRS
jgi:hypothetical protein